MEIIQKIPAGVRNFLIKSALIFIVWKALYHLWLQPQQLVDRPLVNAIAAHSTQVLNFIHEKDAYDYKTSAHRHNITGNENKTYEGSYARIYYKGISNLLIVPNCNALELMVLFAGFIIAFPGPRRKKLWVIPAGIIAIHLVNVLRSVALIRLAYSSYNRFFDFTHHYLFTMSIYLFIFLLWMWYVNSVSKKQDKA